MPRSSFLHPLSYKDQSKRARKHPSLPPMSNNNEKKSSKKPAITIETLIREQNWQEVRKRLKRVSSADRVGEILFDCVDNPQVPIKIFESLLEKLEKGLERRNGPTASNIIYEFFPRICSFQRSRGYSKGVVNVFLSQTVPVLKLFLGEYEDIVGCILKPHCREIICQFWRTQDSAERRQEILSISSLEDLASFPDLQTLWQKTELIVKMTKEGGLDKSVVKLPFVHQMIKIGLPKVVVWMAVRLYPNQVKIKDEFGRLPLHWAAVQNNFDTEEGMFRRTPVAEIVSKAMVELILEVYPDGAKYPDKQGSLPLVLLLDLEFRHWTFNDWTYRSVMALVKQAPEALTQMNTKNRMLPFMTAASIRDSNTVRPNTKREELKMKNRKRTLAYAILRENPTVVASGIVPSAREIYLDQNWTTPVLKLNVSSKRNENWKRS